VAYLSRMPAHCQSDIEIDESTLTNTELRSKNPSVSIVSRPGSYAVVKFPIIRTVELEGHVVVTNGKNRNPVNRALVQLKTPNGEIVAQRRSAFDGFFLFEGIEPGVYQISLEEPLAKRLLKRPGKVTVLSSSGVIRGLDFMLRVTPIKTLLQGKPVQDGTILKQPILESSSPILKLLPAEAAAEVTVLAKQPIAEGKWFVQLGVYGARERAAGFWERISQSKRALQGKTPRFEKYQNMTRLLIAPGQSKNSARQLCQQLKADRLECFIRK
jgi:hypothetical protein